MIIGHGGNVYDMAAKFGCAPSEIIDMSSNVNPLGPPAGLEAFLKENISAITALPEVDSGKITASFSQRYEINTELVLAGNGTTQFIYSIPAALGTKKACILAPTYADYADACIMHNADYDYITADESLSFKPDMEKIKTRIKKYDTVFICNPNNPTGVLIPADELKSLCRDNLCTYFVIDESYLPFVVNGEKQSLLKSGLPNVIILNSMSKIFRVPGLRIGFLASSKKIITKIMRYTLPWSVNSLAQAAVIYLMDKKNEIDSFVEETRIFLEAEKKILTEKFKNILEIKFFPSTTSFLLASLLNRQTADHVYNSLANDRILIRNCSNFHGLSDRFVRVSLKTSKTNRMLAEKLLNIVGNI